MSSNYSRKSTPGSLRSKSGSGRVIIAGKRAMIQRGMRARKGIEARGWDVVIADKIQNKHFQYMCTAILKSIR